MNRFHDLVENWSGWLIHSSWQAAIVVALVAVLFCSSRRASAQFRYAILLLALLKFAVPPFMSLPVGLFAQSRLPLDVTSVVEFQAPVLRGEIEEGDSRSAAESANQSTTSDLSIAPELTSVNMEKNVVNSITSASAPSVNWLVISLLFVHATGVLVAGFGVFRQCRTLRKLVQNSAPASTDIIQIARQAANRLKMRSLPPILISQECDSPFAIGLLRQIVLLPQSVMSLPDDQLRIILGHELVHIHRRDLTVGWFETLLSIVWWFHPGMWWIKRALRSTREDCCDDVLLTSRLAAPERYCETLIQAAARQTLHPLEPIALGLSNDEHPAARRIRRLMDSSLFRTHRLAKSAILLVALLGILLLPGLRAERTPIAETSLEGWFGWRNLSFDPAADELVIINECKQFVIDYRSTYNNDGKTIRRFDDPETRAGLEALLKRKPDFFYTQHLLGTWYRRSGDLNRAQELLSASLKNAPVVLIQRYRTGNGVSLTGVTIEEMSLECNQVKNHSLDSGLKLEFIDLVTDSNGEIAMPAYDTVFRLASRSYPDGYDTEMPRLGWFSAKSRIGVLPEITAWRTASRPDDFTRTAAESALLADAIGTTTNELICGSNTYSIGRIARCQKDGHFKEQTTVNSTTLAALPAIKNSEYMDHAIIDLATPAADRFEITNAEILDSKTKIRLSSFQLAAGVKVLDKTRFHLFSLHDKLPNEIDLVMTVANFEANAFRMIIPPEPKWTYEKGGVKFFIEYLGAGQHVGWSSKEGFYKDARGFDWVSEMLCRIEAPSGQRLALILITKDGQRIYLESISHSSQPFAGPVRIPRPLDEIDHFELVPSVHEQICYFERISLPVRTDSLSPELPVALFQLSGTPETVSSDILSPVVLRCRTRHGDVYDGGICGGRFGFELYEKKEEEWHPESTCTVTLEAYAPWNIKLSPMHLSLVDPAELKSSHQSSMRSSSLGAVTYDSLTVPLSDVGTVAVSVETIRPRE